MRSHCYSTDTLTIMRSHCYSTDTLTCHEATLLLYRHLNHHERSHGYETDTLTCHEGPPVLYQATFASQKDWAFKIG